VALANGIQRYLRENNRPEINIMQKNSPVFPLFQKGIDAKMKELTQAGITLFYFCTKKRCIFSINDIDILKM
jgi:hypothetical protein